MKVRKFKPIGISAKGTVGQLKYFCKPKAHTKIKTAVCEVTFPQFLNMLGQSVSGLVDGLFHKHRFHSTAVA